MVFVDTILVILGILFLIFPHWIATHFFGNVLFIRRKGKTKFIPKVSERYGEKRATFIIRMFGIMILILGLFF